MTGLWYTIDYNNVFISKPRSMARFGLLIQNKGIWNNDTLLHDAAYVQQMTNTSQSLNLGYGYLWWLNGKNSFMVPTLQNVFPGSYAPNAALDMYSGLGKNGQIVSVAPGQKLVVVRMGEQATSTSSDITIQLCDQIWEKLNEAMYCNTTFTFTGNGNWTDASNWSNSMIPPPILPAGSKIIVDPIAGGECVLNTIQQIKTGASISVYNGKKFRIVGNLIQQ
jgi:CubicO group peptidase (beta-lactamase class C family)